MTPRSRSSTSSKTAGLWTSSFDWSGAGRMPRGVWARFCGGQCWKTLRSPLLRLPSDRVHPQHPTARRTGRQRRLQTPGGPRADRALLGLPLARVEGAILELLEQHGSLGYEQIGALLGEPADV